MSCVPILTENSDVVQTFTSTELIPVTTVFDVPYPTITSTIYITSSDCANCSAVVITEVETILPEGEELTTSVYYSSSFIIDITSEITDYSTLYSCFTLTTTPTSTLMPISTPIPTPTPTSTSIPTTVSSPSPSTSISSIPITTSITSDSSVIALTTAIPSPVVISVVVPVSSSIPTFVPIQDVSSHKKSHVGVIAGGIIAGIAVLALVGATIWYFWGKGAAGHSSHVHYHDDEAPYEHKGHIPYNHAPNPPHLPNQAPNTPGGGPSSLGAPGGQAPISQPFGPGTAGGGAGAPPNLPPGAAPPHAPPALGPGGAPFGGGQAPPPAPWAHAPPPKLMPSGVGGSPGTPPPTYHSIEPFQAVPFVVGARRRSNDKEDYQDNQAYQGSS